MEGVRDMKKKSLRILSLIVAIVMVVAMLPLSALAEETKKTRQVGVVVYGAELTQILTGMEAGMQDLEEGDVNIQGTLDDLTALVTDLGTKLADGSGISVPDVDVVLVDENGKEIQLKEDQSIELFTETTETYIPFQNDMEKTIREMQSQLDALKAIFQARVDSLGNVPLIGSTLTSINGKLDNAGSSFTSILENLKTLSTDLFGQLGKMTGLNGHVYRTYVTEEAVPVGNYTVKVKGFTDTDAEGRAMTREGYVLYNDGLGEAGSGYNTERYFDVEIKEKGMFDHDIQFVGPANGIKGEFILPEALNNVYGALANTLNTLTDLLGTANEKITDGVVVNFIADILKAQDLLEWFRGWNTDTFHLPAKDELDLTYKFVFPGLWCAESDAGFAFTDVDVAETGIAGSEYLLVNRDELIDVLKFMKELGKDAFQGAIKATFGGTATYADGTVKDYDSIVNLYFELVKNEDGQLSLDYDTAFAILKTYLGVISDMNLFDRVVDTDTGDALTPIKLKYPIPAFLQATSDENGIVKFNRDSNITLTWMLQIMKDITEAIGDTTFVQDNQVLSLLMDVANYAAPIIQKYGEKIINTLVYPFAQRLGLVGKKMASGNYIMFQTKAAEGYWINPLAYTMILTWENETWLYVTVADLGLIMPYFAAGFYDFVRNTTFAGTIDKFLNQIAGKDVDLITNILTDEIDITEVMGKAVTGALTAFVGQIGFESLGLDTIFSTKSEFVAGLNKYLYENGRTAQNLMIYVNKQAMRAKSVYAGYVTEDWYFYNIDKSPTTTATKLIDKSTKDLAAAFVNPTKSEIITKSGNTVKSIVGSIGYKVEEVAQNIRTQIKSTIGAAIQSVIQKAFDSVKTSITNFAKDMFSRLIHG